MGIVNGQWVIENDDDARKVVQGVERGDLPEGALDDVARYHRQQESAKKNLPQAPTERGAGALQRFEQVDTVEGLAENMDWLPEVIADLPVGPGKNLMPFYMSIEKGMGDIGFGLTETALDIVDIFAPRGSGWEATVNNWKRGLREERAAFREFAESEIARLSEGDEPSVVGEFVGQALPFMWAPQTAATYLRTVLMNGFLGGFGAMAMTPDAEDFLDRVGDAKIGTLLGVGTSAVFSAKPFAQRYMARRVADRLDTEHAQEMIRLEKELQEMMGDPDFSLSAAQITGDPFITGLEYGTAGKVMKQAQNQRLGKLVNFIKARAEALDASGASKEAIVRDIKGTLEDAYFIMNKGASIRYNAGLAELTAKYGDELVFTQGARDYLDDLYEIIGKRGDPRRYGSRKNIPEGLQKHVDFVDMRVNPSAPKRFAETYKDANGKEQTRYVYRVISRETGEVLETFRGKGSAKQAREFSQSYNYDNGGLTVEDVAEVLEGNREIASGATPLFENAAPGSQQLLAKQLMRSLLNNMDASSAEALEGVRAVRRTYARDMAEIELTKRSLLSNVFGDDFVELTPDQKLSRLLDQEAPSLSATRDTLRLWDEELLDQLQGATLRRAIDQSIDPAKPASMIEYDPVKLAYALSKENKIGQLGLGLFDPVEQASVQATAKAVRGLLETYLPFFSKPAQSMAADLSINTVSRTPEFMARFLVRFIGQSDGLAHVLQDQGARDAIQKLAKEATVNGKLTQAGKAAMSYLVVNYGRGEQERAIQEEIERQHQQRLQNLADMQVAP